MKRKVEEGRNHNLIGNKIAVNTVNFLFCGLLQSRLNVDLSNEQLEDCVGRNRVGLFIVGYKVVWGMVWGGVWYVGLPVAVSSHAPTWGGDRSCIGKSQTPGSH